MVMVQKGIRLDDFVVERLETVVKGLNYEAGANLNDFSKLVKIAVSQYLNKTEIKFYWLKRKILEFLQDGKEKHWDVILTKVKVCNKEEIKYILEKMVELHYLLLVKVDNIFKINSDEKPFYLEVNGIKGTHVSITKLGSEQLKD